MPNLPVLIVGAGPTGLMLAGLLGRFGVPFRLIEKNEGPTTQTRAVAVQARTLEHYDQLGLASRALAQGHVARALNIWAGRRHLGRGVLGEMGAGLSPYPYMFMLGQDENERLLLEDLQGRGVEPQWQTELVTLQQDGEEVQATLRRGGQEEHARFAYVAGCDGAHSPVRHAVGVEFGGGTYRQPFFVADLSARGALREGEINLKLLPERVYAFFPLQGAERYRLVGVLPPRRPGQEEVRFEDLRGDLEGELGAEILRVTWFSPYRVHHRVARSFGVGRVFLLGDAAHVHSPVGGQGMNTGLQDAFNLGWKLGLVYGRQVGEALLASYAQERQPIARGLVNTTDRAFSLLISHSLLGFAVRELIVPWVFPRVLNLPAGRRELFVRVSQTGVTYRRTGLSRGGVGRLCAGDRLPWLPLPGGSNFDALRDLRPQLHVYGPVPPEVLAWSAQHPELPLKTFAYTPAAHKMGLPGSIPLLVRPDGYIAYASEHFGPEQFAAYLKDIWAWKG